jgi:uncharacterized protein YjbJ (UPF0337 family)
MTNEYTPGAPAEGGYSTGGTTGTGYTTGGTTENESSTGGTADAAREQAGNVGRDAAESAKNVAGTAKEEVGNVVSESTKQAKALYEEARGQLTEQAGAQQERVASGLRTIGEQLTRMADSSDQPGMASDLVSQLASRTSSVASWLDGRDPGTVVSDVKNFARRKPGTFIAVSAVAGLVAGRLVKSLASSAADEKAAEGTTPASTTPVAPATYVTETPLYDEVRPTATTDFEPTATGTAGFGGTTADGRQL